MDVRASTREAARSIGDDHSVRTDRDPKELRPSRRSAAADARALRLATPIHRSGSRGSLRDGRRLRLRLDVDPPPGEAGGEASVLSLFPDRERELVVGHDHLCRLRVGIHAHLTDLRRLERVRHELAGVLRPGDHVDLLAPQLRHDVAYPRALGAHAGTHRIDGRLVGPHGDLRSMTWLARNRLDLDDAIRDLGHLQLEQLLQQPRVGTADHDLRSLRASTDLGDVGLESLAAAVRLGRDLLRLRNQRLYLPQIQQRVASFGLLDDPGDDVTLAAGELLVGHLAFGVPQLLEDHLLGRLRADPALEVVSDRDLFLGEDLHHEGLSVLGFDLFELLLEHPHLARLRVDLGAEPDEVVIRVRMLLLPRRLVRSRHRLLQTLEDRVEGDPLLALQLAERRDHLGVQACVPFSSAAQSTTVRADPICRCPRRRTTPLTSTSIARSSEATRVPTWTDEPSTGSTVLTSTCRPMHRAN